MNTLKVGIIGAGAIAQKFSDAIRHVSGYELFWVCSAREESANRFAEKNQIAYRTTSVDELLAQDIDFVYVATPNHLHYEYTKKALTAGKHVLCEKPITIYAEQAAELMELSRKTRCLLAEGLWTKALPFYQHLRQLLAKGVIGDVHAITADYFFTAPVDPNHRLFSPEMGGGALLDIGIYEIVLCGMILGLDPVSIAATSYVGITGVDEITAFSLRYANGSVASCICSITTSSPQRAVLMGTAGRIEIEDFGRAEHGTLYVYDTDGTSMMKNNKRAGTRRSTSDEKEIRSLDFPHRHNGFEYQLEAVRDAIQSGLTECPLLNHADSLKVHQIIDRIRELAQ